MPYYDYICEEHGLFSCRSSVDNRKNDHPCKKCGKPSKYTPQFQTQPPVFIGSGFHATDYAKPIPKINNIFDVLHKDDI